VAYGKLFWKFANLFSGGLVLGGDGIYTMGRKGKHKGTRKGNKNLRHHERSTA
jgi:hypothetical protein